MSSFSAAAESFVSSTTTTSSSSSQLSKELWDEGSALLSSPSSNRPATHLGISTSYADFVRGGSDVETAVTSFRRKVSMWGKVGLGDALGLEEGEEDDVLCKMASML